MDIDYFLRTKCEENQVEGVLRTEELYQKYKQHLFKELFAVMIQNINVCLALCKQKRMVMDIIS